MKRSYLILIEEDFSLLMSYFLHGRFSSYNRKRLYKELRETRIVEKKCLPLNVVDKNSKVLVWNMNKNYTFSLQMSLPENISANEQETIVALSIAFLGYPIDSITEWEMPDGINRFKIISVN